MSPCPCPECRPKFIELLNGALRIKGMHWELVDDDFELGCLEHEVVTTNGQSFLVLELPPKDVGGSYE